MLSETEKKIAKYFILFCAIFGVILGLRAGCKAGKADSKAHQPETAITKET